MRYCPRLAELGSGYAFTEVFREDIESRTEQAAAHDGRQPKERWHLRAEARSYDFRSLEDIKSAV